MSGRPFRPAWWLPGPHAQTIGARILRSTRGVRFRRERVATPDGDFLDLDWVVHDGDRQVGDDSPLALVLHGLEGSARSEYVLQLSRELRRVGIDAVGVNFRSCSGEPNRTKRTYHSGETGDLAHVRRVIVDRFSNRPLCAVGFSLGGNVLLKFLGECGAGDGARAQPFVAAVAISVPFDLSASATHLSRGISRIYQAFLMRRLRRKLRAKATLVDDHIDLRRALASRTFWEFDGRVTAPLNGFDDAADYYRRSSSAQFLPHIRVPTLLIHSLDDPFLPRRAVPIHAAAANPALQTVFTAGGGHVGFVSGRPWAPAFWAESTAAEYLAGLVAHACP